MRKMSILVLLACFIGTAFGIWGTNTVVRPNGGNGWAAGLLKPIRWNHSKKDTVRIELWKGATRFMTIADSVQRNIAVSPAYSQFNWTIPASMPAGTYKVRLMNYQNNAMSKDSSDNNFEIIFNPKVDLTAPDGGEVLLKDRPTTITWTSNLPDSVRIVLLQAGSQVSTIAKVLASSNSYVWNVPAGLSSNTNYKIRIMHLETDSATVRDDSYDFIEIKSTPYVVTAPNVSGIKWLKGSAHNVTWTSASATDSVYLKISKGGVLDTLKRRALSGALNTYAWTIPKTIANGTNYKVRINGQTTTSNIDSSNYTFGLYDSLYTSSLVSVKKGGDNSAKIVKRDSTFTITWVNTANIPSSDSVAIKLYKAGASVGYIAQKVPATPASYTWTVPTTLTAATTYSIKIMSLADSTIFRDSTKVFSISDPAINITSPNGGEFKLTGASTNVTFVTTASAGANVVVKLIKGTTTIALLDTISNGTPGALTFAWTPSTSLTAGSDYKIIVYNNATPTIADTSSATFSIAAGRLVTVTSPNGGVDLYRGNQTTITWTHNFGDSVIIALLRNGTVSSILDTVAVTGTGGSYNWNIPGSLSDGYTYKIRVMNKAFRATADSSDANFKILESKIRVTSPDASGVTWLKGSTHDITWVSTGVPEDVKIEYIPDGTGTPVTIIASTPNNNVSANGSIPNSYLAKYTWTLPSSIGTGDSANYKIKITSVITSGTNDMSNELFKIKNPPGISLVTPDATGLTLLSGSTYNITWTDNITDSVKIDLLKADLSVPPKYKHVSWIKAKAPGTSFAWNIPTSLAVGTGYKIRLQSAKAADSLAVRDSSSFAFTLALAPIIVVKPNSVGKYGTWTKDSTVTINYSINTVMTGNIVIELIKGGNVSPVAYTYPTAVLASPVGARVATFKLPTTLAVGTDYKVRVRHSTNSNYSDMSDSNFTVQYAWKKADISDQFIKEFKIEQNYPNPFNNATEIVYYVPTGYNDNVKIAIYNIKGEMVRNLVNNTHTGGKHLVTFNANSFVSGVYYYVIEGKNFKETKRMLLLK